MMHLPVACSNPSHARRGQLKIQQMAFVLVGFVIFFALVALVYISFSSQRLRTGAEDIREQTAQELVRKLGSSPEFAAPGCASCVDVDKLFVLKGRVTAGEYSGFWNVPLVKLVLLSNTTERECTRQTYPNCTTITLVPPRGDFTSVDAFVAACYYDLEIEQERCKLAKLIVGVARA